VKEKYSILAGTVGTLLKILRKEETMLGLVDELLLQALLSKQGIDPEEIAHLESLEATRNYTSMRSALKYGKFIDALGATCLYTHAIMKDGTKVELSPPIPSTTASTEEGFLTTKARANYLRTFGVEYEQDHESRSESQPEHESPLDNRGDDRVL